MDSAEAFIFEMRSAPDRPHGETIDRSALDAKLNDAEEWLTTEAEEVSLPLMVSKQESLEADVRAVCSDYFEVVEMERLAKEKDLDEEAKKAAAEREAEGDDDRAEKDTRRLTKPNRMRNGVRAGR